MGWNKWFHDNISLYNSIKKELANEEYNTRNRNRKAEASLRHNAVDDPDVTQRRKMYSDGSLDKGIEQENNEDRYDYGNKLKLIIDKSTISRGDMINKRYTEKSKELIDKKKLLRISNIIQEKMAGKKLREAMIVISKIEKMIDDGRDGFTKKEYDALVTECHMLADIIHDWNQTTTGEKIKF